MHVENLVGNKGYFRKVLEDDVFMLRCVPMQKFLVTFDIHGCQPGSGIYAEIYNDIRSKYGTEDFCKDFGQFCIVRSPDNVAAIRNFVRDRINSKANRYPYDSADVVVFLVGDEIAITRNQSDGRLNDFARFFRSTD